MSESLPLGEWVDQGVKFVIDNDGGTLERMGSGIGTLTEGLELGLQAIPMPLITALLMALGFWRVGWKFALFCLACCYVIDATGFWPQTMVTLALTNGPDSWPPNPADNDGADSIAGLNGKELRGNLLRVNEEKPRDDKRGGRPGARR